MRVSGGIQIHPDGGATMTAASGGPVSSSNVASTWMKVNTEVMKVL